MGVGINSRTSTTGAAIEIRTPGGVPKIEFTVIITKQMIIIIPASTTPRMRTRFMLILFLLNLIRVKTNNNLGINTKMFGMGMISQSLRYQSEYEISHVDPMIPIKR
jgi:hypothetical protein